MRPGPTSFIVRRRPGPLSFPLSHCLLHRCTLRESLCDLLPFTTMISKHILARLRTLTRPACRSSQPAVRYPNPVQTRSYSDAPLPSPAAPASTPPTEANSHSKSSLNETELKKFAAISETWFFLLFFFELLIDCLLIWRILLHFVLLLCWFVWFFVELMLGGMLKDRLSRCMRWIRRELRLLGPHCAGILGNFSMFMQI